MNTITLSNGLSVGNFSSPHQFNFVDGTILEPVSSDESRRLSMRVSEKISSNNKFEDVEISFELGEAVEKEVGKIMSMDIDVVLIPLPMLLALKREKGIEWVKGSPFRAVRVADRISKKIEINKFCI